MSKKKKTTASKKISKKNTKSDKKKADKAPKEKDVMKKEKNSKPKSFFKSNTVQYMLALIVLILIFVVITILTSKNLVVQEEQKDYSAPYNGFVFEKTSSGMWQTEMKTVLGDAPIIFHYHPLDLEDIEFNKSIFVNLEKSKEAGGLFFVSVRPEVKNNGEIAIAGIEISKMASKVLGFEGRTKSALTEIDPETPSNVASCGVAREGAFVVELGLGNETEIIVKPYCAQLLGSNLNETIKLADAFVYHATGVMK